MIINSVYHSNYFRGFKKIIYRNRVKKAFVVFRDEKLDVMLLKFDPKDFSDIPYLELSFEAVNLGQKVYGVSFPHADQTNAHPIYYNCDITSVENQNKPHLIQINNELSKGCSGMCMGLAQFRGENGGFV